MLNNDSENLIKFKGVKWCEANGNVIIITNKSTGKILLILLSKKFKKEKLFLEFNSLSIIIVIKYPDITKKISTPIKPPWKKNYQEI